MSVTAFRDDEHPGYFYIPNFQYIAGPLCEFDPNSLMREVVTDVNQTIQKALMFATLGTIGELDIPLTNSTTFVGNELSTRGVLATNEVAETYIHAIRDVANELVLALQSDFRGATRQLDYLGSRYVEGRPQDLEMAIRLDKPRLPEFANISSVEEGQISSELMPNLVTVTKLLLGAK